VQFDRNTGELIKLKEQYLTLTGTPYEQSNRRRGRLGLRVFGHGNSDINYNNHVDRVDDDQGHLHEVEGPIREHEQIPLKQPAKTVSRMPSHWQPVTSERTYVRKMNETDARTNLLVISMFVLSLVSTVLVAKVLSWLL